MVERLLETARAAASGYSRNLCSQLAAAIAYRVLFSLFPLAIFLVSLFGLLVQNDERRNDLVSWTVDHFLLSSEGSARVDEAMAGLGKPISALALVALLGVLWGASGMMSSMRVALTSIWGEERRPALRGKAFDLLLVLLAGVLLLVAFGLTVAVRIVEDLGARIGSALGLEQMGTAAGDVTQALVSLAVVFATVLLLYRYVPPVHPGFADLWAPALLVAVAIEVTQAGYGVYLSRFADYNLVYGSLAAVIGFLFLVYLCAAIFLFGAQLAVTWRRPSTAARPR